MTLKTGLSLFIVALCLQPLLAVTAKAQTSRFYFAGYMGLSTFNDLEFSDSATPTAGDLKLDNGVSFSGALGMRISQNLRIETEASYRTADFNHIDVSGSGQQSIGQELETWMGLVNLYYDFDWAWEIQPYVSAGLGFAYHDGVINNTGGVASSAMDNSTNLTWQFGTGLKYRVDPNLGFTAGYRFLDSTDLEIGSYTIDYHSHEFRIGLEYDLPFD